MSDNDRQPPFCCGFTGCENRIDEHPNEHGWVAKSDDAGVLRICCPDCTDALQQLAYYDEMDALREAARERERAMAACGCAECVRGTEDIARQKAAAGLDNWTDAE
jgi:hypothetical protein